MTDDLDPGDLFMASLADTMPTEARVKAAALAIGDAVADFNTAEAVMALCYHLHDLLEQTPTASRVEVLAALIRMIDPPMKEGHA